MGFRSYVRHFCGAISKLFRPSLPWGFAAGSGSLLGVAARHQQQQQERLQQQEKKVAKIIFSMGFRSYVRHFCGAISKLFRPSLPWGFAAGSSSLLGVAASHQQQLQQQEKKVAKIITSFLWVSEVTLGIFAVQFRNLSVLHCHGDLPLGVVRF